jgi:dihydrofolate synthase/folylpolyglutamate synthase
MNDKRLEEIARILFPAADCLVLTEPDNPRAAGIDELLELAIRLGPNVQTIAAKSAGEAIAIATKLTPAGGMICVTGSLYLVGEITAFINTMVLAEARP